MSAFRHPLDNSADDVDDSETLAIRAFGFLLNGEIEKERLFLRIGIRRVDSERPLRPEHMVATLDFLISNELTLLKFARTVELPPDAAYEARRLLSHQRAAVSGAAHFG